MKESTSEKITIYAAYAWIVSVILAIIISFSISSCSNKINKPKTSYEYREPISYRFYI